MKLFEQLSEDNFLLYAAKHYYKPNVIDADEFYEDLKRFQYVKRQLNRYLDSGELSERLILNHLIVIFNVYGMDHSLKMLEFKLDYTHWPVVKQFLVFLKYITNEQLTDVPMDKNVVEKLRKI